MQNCNNPIIIIIWSKMAQLGLEESSEVEGFRKPNQAQIEANVCVSDLGGFQTEKSDVVVGYTSIPNVAMAYPTVCCRYAI